MQFTDAMYSLAVKQGLRPKDVLATATTFTARSIADAYRRFLPKSPDEVILCGGGAWNTTLVGMLHAALPSAKVAAMDEYGISVDAKEAVSFAILRMRRSGAGRTTCPLRPARNGRSCWARSYRADEDPKC